jgi:hypothetical protein
MDDIVQGLPDRIKALQVPAFCIVCVCVCFWGVDESLGFQRALGYREKGTGGGKAGQRCASVLLRNCFFHFLR